MEAARPHGSASGRPAAPPTAVRVLPGPSKDDRCRLVDTEGADALTLKSPRGLVLVRLGRLDGVKAVEVSFGEQKPFVRASVETESFVLHGESDARELVVYPKNTDMFMRTSASYRPASFVVPSSLDPDGQLTLASDPSFRWVNGVPGKPLPTPTSAERRLPCTDLSLRNLRDPKHLARYRASVSFVPGESVDFRTKPTEAPQLRFQPPGGIWKNDEEPEPEVLLLSGRVRDLREVDVKIGRMTHVVGWVPARVLRAAILQKAPVELPRGPAPPPFSYRACRVETPLLAVDQDFQKGDGETEWVQFGHVKAGRAFRGIVLPNGDFRVDLEEGGDWFDHERSAGQAFARITEAHATIGGCAPVPQERYLNQ